MAEPPSSSAAAAAATSTAATTTTTPSRPNNKNLGSLHTDAPNVLIVHTGATADIGNWVLATIQRRIPHLASVSLPVPDEAAFHTAAVGCIGEKPQDFCMIIVILFDGTSDAAKANFAPLKNWAAKVSAGGANVVVQALNAKKGQHSLFANEDALISSLSKKLPPRLAIAAAGSGSAVQQQQQQQQGSATAPAAVAGGAAPPSKAAAAAAAAAVASGANKTTEATPNTEPPPMMSKPINFEDISPENIITSAKQGQGECCWLVTARTKAQLDEKIAALRAAAAKAECAIAPVTEVPRQIDSNLLPKVIGGGAAAAADTNKENTKDGGEAATAAASSSTTGATTTTTATAAAAAADQQALAWEFLVRRADTKWHMEMRLCVCGNVDSGKSTLTSVLTKGFKDDGRGFARAKVFNHRHEQQTGRTSSISENHLGFDPVGNVVNYPPGGPTQAKHTITAEDMFERSSKILTLYDLAGHEKYLKTTVLGMTRSAPDYAVIVISANNGIQRMTREHLGLCLALRLPFFIVITRIDATPETVRQETISSIKDLLKLPTVRKLYYTVKSEEDAIVCSKNLRADRIAPVFEVSNVTMEGIALLTKFLNLLPVRRDWHSLQNRPAEMIIDSTFFVTGVGTVVGGVVTQGIFKVNDTVMLGPDGIGNYRSTQIKSIHVKGYEVDMAECGNDAALCLRKERRNAIRKGNVVVHPSMNPKGYWQFTAEIRVLYNSTTIESNYEPVIHTPTARQAARITLEGEEAVLRTGDTAVVKFHFLYRPEYLKLGHRLIFREGRTKGIGTITALEEQMNPTILGLRRQEQKEQTRDKLSHPLPGQPGGPGGAAGSGGGGAAAPASGGGGK